MPERALLEAGQYAGRVSARRSVRGITLTETHYPPFAVIPAHEHREGYFCLVRSGGYEEEFGGQVRTCGPSTVAFHPPGERHSERFGGAVTRSFNVEPSADWLGRHELQPAVFEWAPACEPGEIRTLARQLHSEFRSNDAASALAVEGLVLQILAWSARSGQRERGARQAPSWIHRICERLHDLSQPVPSLGELAGLARVHPVYLARAFRQWQGVTVGAYSRGVRLEAATQALLAAPQVPLKAVAEAAGFASQSHFTKWFRRLTGTTPGEFRRAR